MCLRSPLESVATCAILFSLLSSSASSQSAIAKRLPAELTRPELFQPPSKLTPNEQALLSAVAKLDAKDEAASVKTISEFISKYPTVGSGYALRASEYGCEAAQPDIEKASEDANRALKLPSGTLNFGTNSVAILAKADLRLNRPKEAIAVLADAIAHNLKNTNDLLQSKTGKIEQNDASLCTWGLSDFDTMANASPNDWRVALIRGVYYSSLVNLTDQAIFAKAIEQYRKSASINPRSAVPEYLLGDIQTKMALFSEKSMRSPEERRVEYLKAVPAFTDAIRRDPGLTLAYLGRAEAFLEAKDQVQAVRDFTVVLKREPENSSALADRGIAYEDNHNYYSAISDFGDAIQLKLKTGDVYLNDLYENRGDAYLAVKDISKAIDDYTNAISLTLGRQLILMTLAQTRSLYPEVHYLSDKAFLHVLYEGFAPTEKEEDFDKLISGEKSSWEVSFILSNLYEKRGDSYLQSKNYPLALRDFRRIYEGVPNMASSLERWRSLGFDNYLLDVKTSSIADKTANLWVKKVEKSGATSVINFSIGCDARRIKQASSYTYDRDGNLKNKEDSGVWDGVIPDTFGEYLWEASCESTTAPEGSNSTS
ncbi:tetratricopeptide repeat protein [Granulicella sp. L46]|uniref:tetratricopeptide repeat protein n=1 Tax=Granulicella sp. L46 TaxID=1641865 RepID=UPI00131E9FCD|nr:tetratricopeptide repeat protein [Granulicella sp. L46]